MDQPQFTCSVLIHSVMLTCQPCSQTLQHAKFPVLKQIETDRVSKPTNVDDNIHNQPLVVLLCDILSTYNQRANEIWRFLSVEGWSGT